MDYNTSIIKSGCGITRATESAYLQATPALLTEIDTGVALDKYCCSTTEIAFAIVVNITSSGNNYIMQHNRVSVQLIKQGPNIRFAKSDEFEAIAGDVNYSFWYDDTTDSIHYIIDVDGADKTVTLATMQISYLCEGYDLT